MADDLSNLFTAGAIAKTLGVSDGKVKKAITELKLKPEAKKGVCNYYGKSALEKIRKALQ
jgi:hypothetical protein